MSNFKLGPYFKMNPSGKEHDGLPNELEVFSCTIDGDWADMSQNNIKSNAKYISGVSGPIGTSEYDGDDSVITTAFVLTEEAAKKFKYVDIYLYASTYPQYGTAGVQLVPTYTSGSYSFDDLLETGSDYNGVLSKRYTISDIKTMQFRVWVDNDSTYSGYASYIEAAPYRIVLSNVD